MLREHFRVKPYSDRRYKFVVRAKIDGKWRRRYFRNETEAQAYADKQNSRLPATAEKSPGRALENGRTGQANEGSSASRGPTSSVKQTLSGPQPPKPTTPDVTSSKAPRIAHYLGGA